MADKKRVALVGVKRCIDYAVRIRVKPDGTGVVTQNMKMSMNPFDEIAVTEAVRLKNAKHFDEVVAVSVGPKECQETIRRALAMGADRGIHVETAAADGDGGDLQPLSVAKVFKAVADKEKPSLVILGKQAIDDDTGATGQMLAGMMNCSQGLRAYKLNLGDKEHIEVTKEMDAGLETVKLQLPAVVTCDLRLCEPVFAKLPEIMKAKKKPLETLTPSSLGVEVKSRLQTVKVTEPPKRQAGSIVKSVDELIAAFKKEGFLD
eukprot:TRINITY_DN922_c0_g1_i1.p1 TRINITY_DN922_c0_g1~~TRINITY_DN922_c0_g1_i1.p1  ORF type:complete len:262 (-),score=53.60 TRINITY_DN922_c0_g1_i1:48-833(-)